MLKLRCDASTRGSESAALAGVVMDCNGEVCWCVAEIGGVGWDVQTMEAMAVLKGM